MICYLYMVPIADRFVPTLNLSLWCLLCNHPPPQKKTKADFLSHSQWFILFLMKHVIFPRKKNIQMHFRVHGFV